MKDWTGNRKSTFVTLGASNHTDKKRESNDFYATDPIAIDKLVKAIHLPHKIWECACGTGCLSDRLKDFGYDVVSTDLVDRGYGGQAISWKPPICPAIVLASLPIRHTSMPWISSSTAWNSFRMKGFASCS